MSRMAFLTRALAFSQRRAAQLVERRVGAAGVFLDEVEALERNEQLVLAGVAELHELLRVDAHLDLLQADEPADAVVDVDDEVADLQVAEIRDERRAADRRRSCARRSSSKRSVSVKICRPAAGR